MDNLTSIVSCNYCGYFPVDPVESNCCGGIYCWACVMNVTECQVCGEKLNPEMYHPARAIKNLITQLSNDGGKIVTSSCTKPNKDIKVASMGMKFSCPEGCGVNDMACSDQAGVHLCPKVQMPCKNVGCKVMCTRAELNIHIAQCELKIIDCPYGCGLILRRDYDAHKKLNTEQHLDKLLKIVEDQKNEIKELKKHPAAVFDQAFPEAFPKRMILIILFMVCMFMPLLIKLPIFVLCFVRVYQVLFCPYVIDRGTVLLSQKGFSASAIRMFSAICHLLFVWQCAILIRAF